MLKELSQYPLKIKGISDFRYEEIKNPYNGQSIASVGQADEQAIAAAIGQAQETFARTMSKMPAYKRADILNKTADALLSRHEELAQTIALEGGKPIKDARVEVSRSINTFRIAAQESLRLDGEQIPMDRNPGNEGRLALVVREPIGVICGITPFNFPLNLVAHKVAPAIAAGNVIVLKPSSQTPVSSLKLAEIMEQCGLPEGALIVVPCRGSKGQALVTDRRLAMLTFTGSPAVGWQLRKEIAPGVRIILELGGNAGIIVHDDADIEAAAKAACKGGYANAGQTCISVQRVYVQEKIYARFTSKFVELVKNLKSGDPSQDDTDVGPLIDGGAVRKTVDWISEAVAGGATLLAGGEAQANNIVQPTVLADTTASMKVVCQEVFGPIVSLMKYKELDQAIASMNDGRFGLQAGIFSQNIEVALRAARSIDVGGVMINDAPTFRADHMPYGGRKESGLGLEGVRYALQEMTQPKFICINLVPSE